MVWEQLIVFVKKKMVREHLIFFRKIGMVWEQLNICFSKTEMIWEQLIVF